jgi:predicted DNA-binding transcriptional regulator AlpA
MTALHTFHHIGAALTGSLPAKSAATLPAYATASCLLLDSRQSAQFLGISVRKFHAMRAELPQPVVLGARCVRWRMEELLAFVHGLQAANEPRMEPPQLRAGRQRRQLSGGDVAGLQGQGAEGLAEAGVGANPALPTNTAVHNDDTR